LTKNVSSLVIFIMFFPDTMSHKALHPILYRKWCPLAVPSGGAPQR
jgi:hypothetical protein